MRQLAADISRCAGTGCERRDTCARYVTQQFDERGATYLYSDQMCIFIGPKLYDDHFIPLTRMSE